MRFVEFLDNCNAMAFVAIMMFAIALLVAAEKDDDT